MGGLQELQRTLTGMSLAKEGIEVQAIKGR